MEYREKGNQSKGFELKRLQKEHPDFSPFVLLKLSLIRYGAVLTKRAKKEIVRQNLQFLSDAAFGLQFGEKEEYVITAKHIWILIKLTGAKNKMFFRSRIDWITFVERPDFFDQKTSSGIPWHP